MWSGTRDLRPPQIATDTRDIMLSPARTLSVSVSLCPERFERSDTQLLHLRKSPEMESKPPQRRNL